MVHFTNFCKPEKTFSGFRSDLVSCVKAFAFLSVKTTELQGLRWISGKTDVRLLVWRLPGSSSGSSKSKLVYSRLSAFSVSQVIQFGFRYFINFYFRKNLSGLLVLPSLMLYIVNIINFICSLIKIGSLAPCSTVSSKKYYLSNGAGRKTFLRTDKSQCGI